MSLISLLIALAAERYLSSPLWQFSNFYKRYLSFVKEVKIVDSPGCKLPSIIMASNCANITSDNLGCLVCFADDLKLG